MPLLVHLYSGLTHQPPEVCGRDDLANYAVAEAFRVSLEQDDHLEAPEVDPTIVQHPTPHKPRTSFLRAQSEDNRFKRLLAQAFRREYAPRQEDKTAGPPIRLASMRFATGQDAIEAATSHRQIREKQDRPSGKVPQSTTLRKVPEPSMSNNTPLPEPASCSASHTVDLYGLEHDRKRNVWGRAVEGGQEHGVNVIGASLFMQNHQDGDIDVDCDTPIPVIDKNTDFKIRHLSLSEAGSDKTVEERYIIGPQIIELSPHLPPLAKEHPARVWNSIVNSLPEETKPVMRSEYSSTVDQQGWSSILPPSIHWAY